MANSDPRKRSATSQSPIRKSFILATTIGLLVVVFLLNASKRQSDDSTVASTNAASNNGPAPKPFAEANTNLISFAPSAAHPSPSTLAPRPEIQPSDKARQLVKALSEIEVRPGELTPDKADKWKRNLEELIEEGRGAVPVLREFFEKNQNVRFDSGAETNLLGDPTLRIAFMKVLFDIPTPDNVELQEQLLRTTTDPDEVALLARQLELQEPGVYRGIIIKAIKDSIMMAKNGELPDRDVTPLFEILAQYGITSVK